MGLLPQAKVTITSLLSVRWVNKNRKDCLEDYPRT